MSIREIVVNMLGEVAEMTDSELIPLLNDGTVLLESVLDSLGFAILVARLEEELEYDPFTQLETVIYPRTLGEFIAIYEQNK